MNFGCNFMEIERNLFSKEPGAKLSKCMKSHQKTNNDKKQQPTNFAGLCKIQVLRDRLSEEQTDTSFS